VLKKSDVSKSCLIEHVGHWILIIFPVHIIQTLSKTLNRPVVQLQNVGGVIPPAHCSAQALQAILPAAGNAPGK
jgi:hypothetical protein